MRFFALTLLSAAMTTTTAAASNENPDYALTVYSSAAPGSIDMQHLANYGQNLPGYALVRDRRQMFLPDGRGELRFTDVAAHMDPTTVSFSALDHPDATRVLEQNFQFDLVDAQKLLQRYIGERVRVDQNLERMREFLALVGAGYTDHEAATAVGYSRWAPVHWKRSQPGFMEAYNHAKHVNVDALITEAKRRALRGSDRLLEFLLCNLASEQFKRTDSQRVDVNVNLAERLTAGRRRAGG